MCVSQQNCISSNTGKHNSNGRFIRRTNESFVTENGPRNTNPSRCFNWNFGTNESITSTGCNLKGIDLQNASLHIANRSMILAIAYRALVHGSLFSFIYSLHLKDANLLISSSRKLTFVRLIIENLSQKHLLYMKLKSPPRSWY